MVLRANPVPGHDAMDALVAWVSATSGRARSGAATDRGARLFSPGGDLVPAVLFGIGLQAAVVHSAGHAAAGAGARLLRGRRLLSRLDSTVPLGRRCGRKLSDAGRRGRLPAPRLCGQILHARANRTALRGLRPRGPGPVLSARLGRRELLFATQ